MREPYVPFDIGAVARAVDPLGTIIERQKALGLCQWQTGYGLPHTEFCSDRAGDAGLCKEHAEDLRANYPKAT